MSVIYGRLDVLDAMSKIMRLVTEERAAGRQVRYARAGDLRDAGFGVVHTPSKANKLHCSVVWPPEPNPGARVPWPDDLVDALQTCFTI
jgi:hypothetical protein